MLSDLNLQLLSLATSPEAELRSVLAVVLTAAVTDLHADLGGLFLYDPAASDPELVASVAHGRGSDTLARFLDDQGRRPGAVLLEIHREGEPRIVAEPPRPSLSVEARSALWFPLADHHRVIGQLVIESERPAAFSPRHVRQLELLLEGVLPGIYRTLLRERLRRAGAPVDVVGTSPAFLDLERQIRLAGTFSDGAVLVTGERGSGKELVAWAIHCWSRRRERPFVTVLASGFTETLLADDLFGHERHAFTGASERRAGRFEAAEAGTLFLDEIGDLPANAQAALLRAVERGEIQRLGRDDAVQVDVRVVAATNCDLVEAMADGSFREDLYDRLSLFEVRVPPLRERREDIPALARFFLRTHCRHTWRFQVFEGTDTCLHCGRPGPAPCATQAFFAALQAYHWPGNVRELRHLMIRLAATVPDEVLDVRHLPERLRTARREGFDRKTDSLLLDDAISDHIRRVLRNAGGNQSEAARLLGLPLSTLRSKMKKLGIELVYGRAQASTK